MKTNEIEIIGYSSEKKELEKLKSTLLRTADYSDMGIRVPGGLVIYGPSGSGKTLLATSIESDEIKMYEITEADILSEDEFLIKGIFDDAKNSAPAIVLLDGLDKVLQSANKLLFNKRDSVKQIIKAAISELKNNDGILVVITCNSLNSVKDIVLDTGRFDRIIELKNPDEEHRKMLLRYYFSNSLVKLNINIDMVSNMMHGFSIRDIKNVVNESVLTAISDGKKIVEDADVETAIKNRGFMFDLSDRFNDPDEKHKVAVHEAGHILAAKILNKTSIKIASVIPQDGNIGHIQLDDNDGVLDISDIEDLIAVALAGRVAERELIGNISVGASSDLEKAVFHARELIVKHVGCGYDFVAAISDNEISYDLMYEIEKRIAQMLSEQDQRIKNLIIQHKDLVLKIADMLEENNILDQHEIANLFNKEI